MRRAPAKVCLSGVCLSARLQKSVTGRACRLSAQRLGLRLAAEDEVARRFISSHPRLGPSRQKESIVDRQLAVRRQAAVVGANRRLHVQRKNRHG